MLIERHAKPRSDTMRNHDRLRCELAIDHRANMHPEAHELGSIVHCSVPSGDGQLYLCDRVNNRAQVFDILDDGSFRFVRNLVIAPKTGGLGTVTDIALSPDKKYLYVADMANGRVWIL